MRIVNATLSVEQHKTWMYVCETLYFLQFLSLGVLGCLVGKYQIYIKKLHWTKNIVANGICFRLHNGSMSDLHMQESIL